MTSSATLQLDAHRFSRAFVNVSNAYIPTKGVAELTRTVLIEIFYEIGIQLVASDGLLLMRQFVPLDSRDMHDEPTSDVLPDESVLVCDPDKLGLALAKVIYAHSKVTADETGISEGCVELQVRPLIRHDTPALPGLDPWAMTIAFGDQRTQLPVMDIPYRNWRLMMTDEFLLPDAIETLVVAPKQLARIGKIKGNDGGIVFNFIGNGRPVVFTANDSAGAPVLRGLLASMTKEVKAEIAGAQMEGQQVVDFGPPQTIDPSDPDVIDPFGEDDDDVDLEDM